MVTFVSPEVPGDERGALLSFVESQRGALRRSVHGLSEAQAASCPSASELTLAGLLKHSAEVELNWLRLAQQQPNERQRSQETWADGFRLVGAETVAEVLAFWDDVAAQTERFAAGLPAAGGLDRTFPLPPAPWFPEDGKVSVRWMLLHLVEEFARHAGHADIVRESLDGRTSLELVELASGQSWGQSGDASPGPA
ncbi:DinB family protein [Streptomyces sp. NPDC051567]|uniref:DinB family protein n=1 Tax=Streptomyces sp. NPDC051567 TaxID=3365660 RepID=UPI003794C01D